ncbi:MAG TPA: amidohydrolase/deacetylase family metallohydrolase [Acidimicrobiales bacterium]|nr:amidohydrolase/deacetylase family metallohydrolase [Acidimicrobiales bacterium]
MPRRQREFDLLVRSGRIIDPASSRDEIADIAVTDGRIVEIDSDIEPTNAMKIIDATGLIVTPGLIDLHVHAFQGVNTYGMDVDPLCLETGVTTAVDAGSSGPVNFAGFRDFVVRHASTRLFGFVAVAQHGVTREPGDLVHSDLADAKGAAHIVLENPDIAVGIKIRLAADKVATDGRDALDLALEAGAICGRPVMVHIGETPLRLEEIVAALRPGDIITHCYTPLSPSVTDDLGRLRDGMLAAQERGVIFDVAHAGGHFGFDVVRNALSGGLMPNSLSTDIHARTDPRGRGFLLTDVMSKFMALGLELAEVIRLTTSSPAKIISQQDRIGSIAIGREADIAVLALNRGHSTFVDSEGQRLDTNARLEAKWTIRAGEAHATETCRESAL